MPKKKGTEGGPSWILEPPGPDEISFSVAIGPQVEVTPETRSALEALMNDLADQEVADFVFGSEPASRAATEETTAARACVGLRTCAPYKKCTVLTTQPNCYVLVHCRIAP